MTKGFYILLFFVALLFAEACKNNDEVFPTVTYAAVNVVNASPDTLNYYLNGTRQNNTSSLFPDGQSYYTPPIPSGKENFQFKKAGSFNVLFSFPATLADSTNYSLYLTSGSASGAFIATDILDTTNTQDGVNFKLRFVNASPDAGPVNVTVDSLPYNNISFKTITPFTFLGQGSKEVKVFQSGSTTASIDTFITFNTGHLYTLYSKGLLRGKGTAVFDVGVALNY